MKRSMHDVISGCELPNLQDRVLEDMSYNGAITPTLRQTTEVKKNTSKRGPFITWIDDTHYIKGGYTYDTEYQAPTLQSLPPSATAVAREQWEAGQEEAIKAYNRRHFPNMNNNN